jgi:hypothetical protein
MPVLDFQIIMSVIGAFIAIGTAWITIKKIMNYNKSDKKAQSNEILRQAREEMDLKSKEMELRVQAVEDRMANLEKNVEKDIDYIKQAYTNEIKMLGEKIENLRDELRGNHANLLGLITKLIER